MKDTSTPPQMRMQWHTNIPLFVTVCTRKTRLGRFVVCACENLQKSPALRKHGEWNELGQ